MGLVVNQSSWADLDWGFPSSGTCFLSKVSLGAEVWGEGKGQNICGPASFSKIPVEGVELPSLGPVPPPTFLALPGTPTLVLDSSSETLSKRHGQVLSPLSS